MVVKKIIINKKKLRVSQKTKKIINKLILLNFIKLIIINKLNNEFKY